MPNEPGGPTCRIFLVRHGATEWTESGQHTGRTDLTLTAAGREQAAQAGRLLAGRPFALVLTSPLARAAETCALAGFGPVAEPDPDLVEWDYGDFEGRTTDDIRREQPGWNLWADGVPGGERAGEVGRRVDRVMARARAQAGDTLCFAHGHVGRVLAARWVGLPAVGGRLLVLEPGRLCVLGWEREDPVISRWNGGHPLPS